MMLLASLALAAGPDAATAAAMSGDWRLAEPRPTVQARVDAAIEGLLAAHNVVVRSIARPKLATAATVCDTYRTAVSATEFSVMCDGRPAATVPFDQPPRPGTSPDGRAFSVAAKWDGAAVVLTFTGDEGGQVVRYRVSGGELHVEKTLVVERLDAKMSWPMRYAR